MARTRSNKSGESSGTLVLLGVAAVGVYGYMQGWFTGLFGTTVAAAAPAATTTGTTAVTPPPATAAAPPLGTIATTAAQIAAQVAANDAYIIPGPALMSQPPSGYTLVTDTNNSEVGYPSGTTAPGGFYVRNDVANALLGVVNVGNVGTSNPPATLANLYQFPVQNLAQLQKIMSGAGLSGMAGFGQYIYSRTGRYR